MARLVTDPVEADVDYHLQYQADAWASIPEVVEAWEEMDPAEREVFHLEWVGITEARLKQLGKGQQDTGRLTPDQQARYAQVCALVSQHRPTVERLLTT